MVQDTHRRWPSLLATLLVVFAFSALPGQGPLLAAGTTATIQTASNAGDIHAALTIPRNSRGYAVARLWQGGRPLTHHRVLIILSRLLNPHTRTQVMQEHGNTYRATLPAMQRGWWELSLRLPEKGRTDNIPFLLHVSPGLQLAGAYPLFSPAGSMRAAASPSLGPRVAALQLAIGAAGDSKILIRLRPATGPLPAHLQLALSMLDMPMPTTRITARQAGPGEYAAEPFFSMPGVWQVNVSDGHADAAAALLIGKPNER